MVKNGLGLTFIFIFIGLNLFAQDFTRWRGADGNGIYPEQNLLKLWPSEGPEIIWHQEGLGEGHSSAVFANSNIYLSGMIGQTGYIFVLDNDGNLKWKAPYGEEYYESYPGARSSPVVAGDLLYIYSGHGVLTCMNASTGDIKWKKDAFSDFDGGNITWGVTETVVVDGDVVYLTPGGKKHNVVALNRFNGNLIWTSSGKGEKSAYCTPLLINLPSRKLLVTHTEDHIIGLDAKDGRLLWSYPHTNRHKIHPNTPVYHNGELLCFSGYGQGSVKLSLSDDGSTIQKSWDNVHLDSRMGGMVLVDGYLYGSGDNSRQWRCVDWETGEERYNSTEIGKGVVIASGGLLFCYSEKGELALVPASPEGFDVLGLSSVELGSGQHWSHPVINNGRLYLRHGDVLIAYKIK